MIFALVGTHEQQFNRLVKMIDELETEERRIIQYGYSNCKIRKAESYKFLSFDEVKKYMQEASVVITHAGTGSVMLALSLGKIPIVVARYKKYGEHIDDHQLQLIETLMDDNLVVPCLDGDSLVSRIEEVNSKMSMARKIEPDMRLISQLKKIIDES